MGKTQGMADTGHPFCSVKNNMENSHRYGHIFRVICELLL
ncbi:MAG: hypothetical protein HPY66_0088 [Firmicutes bacterium]|nr:hypothetical protein [Bacillota bacterium]